MNLILKDIPPVFTEWKRWDAILPYKIDEGEDSGCMRHGLATSLKIRKASIHSHVPHRWSLSTCCFMAVEATKKEFNILEEC